MNSVYDVDPSVGGGTCSFFPEWAALYTRYRVLKFHYVVEFANESETTAIVAVVPTKTSFGNNYNFVSQFSEAPYGKSAVVATGSGMNKATLRGSVDLTKFSGYAGYRYDDVSSGLVTGNPVQLYYFQVGLETAGATVNAAVRVQFSFDVQFFQQKVNFVS